MTIENAVDPVVLEGTAEIVSDMEAIAQILGLVNRKYGTSYGLEFLAPAVNATIRVRPHRAFGLVQKDFGGSPTRWIFES